MLYKLPTNYLCLVGLFFKAHNGRKSHGPAVWFMVPFRKTNHDICGNSSGPRQALHKNSDLFSLPAPCFSWGKRGRKRLQASLLRTRKSEVFLTLIMLRSSQHYSGSEYVCLVLYQVIFLSVLLSLVVFCSLYQKGS